MPSNQRAEMKGVIYCYHCIPTGKKYIGKTKNEYQRRKRHEHNARKGNITKFYNAIRKYGWENFVYGVIEEVDLQILNEKEIFYISEYDTYNTGYNMTIGGDGNTVPGELCRIRSRQSRLGKPLSEETKKKLREAHLGKSKHTEESKRKLREENLGKKYNLELRKKLSEIRKGKKGTPHTEETKKRLSDLAKGRSIGKRWWNNGQVNKFVVECPGDNWVLGKISPIKLHCNLYKTCKTCGNEKLCTEFYFKNKKEGRRNASCKKCDKEKYKKSKK